MRPHTQFKHSILAKSIGLMLGTAVVAPSAIAQQAGETEIVQVTGIRGSLARSMDVKRESVGIVDAITAEDIGKFPDSNLAESLQRITGVSIDRRNGEGFQISVRGFGPEFNQVTLNGRTMPAAQLKETGELNTSRSFDMSNIASEGVSGATIFKSGQANITSGGIGATVDLQTRKPFQNDGFHASIGAKAVHDTTSRVGDDITPELSGFASWSNDVWGVSVSASHQKRDNGRTGAFTNEWTEGAGAYSGAFPNGTTSDVVIKNAPAIGTQTNFTPGLRYNHADFERERQNAQITLQFRPTDNIEATLDYTHAEQDIQATRNELSFWFGGGAFPTSAIEFETTNGVATPIYWLTENEPNDYLSRDVNFGVQGGHVKNKLDSLGLNVKWQASDELSVKFDYHDSSASALPGGNGPGNWYNVGIGGQGTSVQGIDNSGPLPLLVGVWDERDGITGNIPGQIDIGDMSSTVRQIHNDRTHSDIQQTKLDFEYQLSDEVGIDFGIESRDMEYSNQRSFDQTVLEGNWGASNPGDIPASMVDELNFHDLFDGYSSNMSSGAESFFKSAYGGEAGGQFTTFGGMSYIGDANALGKLLSSNVNLSWEPNPVDSTNRLIQEKITAAYTQMTIAGEMSNNMTYDIIAGVRYESTDVSSTAQVAAPAILWQGDNDFLVQGGDASTAPLIYKEANYDHVLPSISLSLGVTDDIVARMSWSKTIARADYAVLQHGVSGIGGPVGGPTILGADNGTATNGNVGLMPIESNNLDFSVEWYYDDSSYVSVGYFDKRVPNFIGTQEVVTIADSTRDPSNGPRAAAALAELGRLNLPVNQQNLFRMVASMDNGQGGCVKNTNVTVDLCGADFDSAPYEGADGWENGVDIVALSEDPLSVLDAATPVNANDAHIAGWEFAVQHFFADTGFGIQANATLVNGSVAYDVADTSGAAQFALTGLSDSANMVFIYENDQLQARLTYNWRDEFLNNANAGSNEPEFTEAYEQVDFSVGYNISDQWSVSFEGINILEQDLRRFGRSKAQFRSLEIYGARYALSTRYTF